MDKKRRETAALEKFLQTVVAPTVDIGTVSGVQALTNNWRLFTEFFPDIRVQLNRPRNQSIAARLADHRIVMQGPVRFNWDNTSNRMSGLYTQTDMVSPLLQLLGNLEDVLVVFSQARLTSDGIVVVGEGVEFERLGMADR
ncbi:unnamed protein product [Phytophthora lilii]|uniref:Unnamed protein product n=1 Tax=Phytophthora lilii TaxID=2077276 RepID=A0A9W6THN4_9STRA|nr:unnamed protein product [Phytophthora lilii]